MNELIDRLRAFYGHYHQANLADLAEIYDQDTLFTDPVHSLTGLDAIHAYFDRGRSGLLSCRFVFESETRMENRVVLEWQMHFSHRRLNCGKPIVVDGCSVLDVNMQAMRVQCHRDYFDLGGMLYEHVPVLGGLVKSIKSRLS